MPPFQSELPPSGKKPENELEIWERLREFFEGRLRDIRMVCQAEGHEKAEHEHEKMLQGTTEWERWDEMFLQGFMRNPHSAETIERARNAYFKFLAPLQHEDQERIGKLRYMKRRLKVMLRRVEAGNKKAPCKHLSEEADTYLREAFIEAESYQDLIHRNPEARELIQDIIEMIGDLAALVKNRRK